MHRKQLQKSPWILALAGLVLVTLPAFGQGYAYQVEADGEPQVWASGQRVDDDAVHKEHVRIVVVNSEDGEPKTYEWKTEDGKVITIDGDENVHFIEDMMRRGYLGVQLVELTPELRQHYGATPDSGVLIGKVEPGSPAEAAGLQVGDVLFGLDGEEMGSSRDIRRHIRALEEGEAVAIEVLRNGSRLDLSANIVVKERPEVDIRHFFGQQGNNPFVYHVDPGQMGEAIIDLKEHFSSPEFRTRVQTFTSREEELEEKLHALEKKLEELAKQLAEKQ